MDELGISAYGLANTLGVTPSIIYMITSGKRELTEKMAILISHHYGYNQEWIMGRSNIKHTDNKTNSVIYNKENPNKEIGSNFKEAISKRIIELTQNLWLNKKIKNDSDFCRKVEIDQPSWVLIKNGKRNFPVAKLDLIVSRFNVNKDWLMLGEGPMFLSEYVTKSNYQNLSELSDKNDNKTMIVSEGIPYYNVDVSASAGIQMFSDVKEIPSEKYIIPGFEDCDFAVPVFGHSMYPTYENGTIIMCKKIEDKSLIVFGEAYLIVTADYRMVKRLQRSDEKGHVLACSDNEENRVKSEKKKFEPVDIPIDKILFLYLVKGVIKRNQL